MMIFLSEDSRIKLKEEGFKMFYFSYYQKAKEEKKAIEKK